MSVNFVPVKEFIVCNNSYFQINWILYWNI